MGTYIAKDATGTRALDVTGNARRREITTHCGCGDCQGTLIIDEDTAEQIAKEAHKKGAAVITFADFRRGK